MQFTFTVFEKSRAIYNSYLETLSLEELNTIPQGFNNNIIWNISHIVVTQQILMYKLSGLPVQIAPSLIDRYKKGTRPEQDVSQKEVDDMKALLFETISQTQTDYNNKLFVNFQEYTVSTTGNTLQSVEDAITFALFHEGLHLGVVKGLLNAIKL
ncbi:DinB family protein [Formosa sp. A9]|uniref:DinB family protein n=1 Tax=Formosa sp. A9 TaxID=3442641 RepID=UPI003EB7E1A4